MRKTEIEGRVIGGDLIRQRVVWCWSAAVVWCWSMEFFVRQSWCWSQRVRREGEWDEREREREREKLLKYLCKCYSNRALCIIIVVIVHKCTILHPLMWVLFWAKMCKSTTFFYFAKVFTGWCNCSNHPKIPVTLHFFILLKSPNQMDLMYS